MRVGECAFSIRMSRLKSDDMSAAVGVFRYGVSRGRVAAGCDVADGVDARGVGGAVVSVRGVLCLLDERRSRDTFPVPFFEADGMARDVFDGL